MHDFERRNAELASHLSLSRLNHWLPRDQAHSEVMQGTADFHHDITNALLPQADPVFDDATTAALVAGLRILPARTPK